MSRTTLHTVFVGLFQVVYIIDTSTTRFCLCFQEATDEKPETGAIGGETSEEEDEAKEEQVENVGDTVGSKQSNRIASERKPNKRVKK